MLASVQSGIFSQFKPAVDHDPAVLNVSARSAQVPPFRVLIVEASVPLARLLATGLLTGCSSVEVTHDLASGVKQFEKLDYELLIIDLDMPDMDVQGVFQRLRVQHPDVRILALSRQCGIDDMVSALDNGADDYLSKPFSLLELMARVRALRRRSQMVVQSFVPKIANLVLHRDQCRVERDGRFIDLTPREFALLEYLMRHPGKTLSRAVLTHEVWNMSVEGSTNIVDVYIKYLRDKLDGDYDVKLIRTVRGLGYSYQAEA